MSKQIERVVNVVPYTRIKKEVIEDEEDTVQCRLCSKGFVSEMALNNHARMEHMDAYASGDRSVWTQIAEKPVQPQKAQPQKANITWQHRNQNLPVRGNKEQMVTSFSPASLMALASNDVSYIIIRSEDDHHLPKKKKMEKMVKEDRVEKFIPKREKQTEPITGPFECLQPSTLVADGTCHQIFFSCCEYSMHYRDEHTRRRKGLRCQVCEKPLAGSGDDQAPYSCDVCGVGCQTNKELSEHTALNHVKLKPYECSICGKRFTQQGGVQQHMRMHTGDRPFPCTFCPKAFTQKSGLDQHLRIHTKVKPYRCVVCSKTFCQSVHLKQHMRTHTNVAPFQCGICEKRFKQSSHLNYHLKNHNPATLTVEQREKYAELCGIMNVHINEANKDGEEVNYIKEDNDGEKVNYINEDNGVEVNDIEEGNDVEEIHEVEEINDMGEICDTVVDNGLATQWCVTIDSREIIGI